MQVDGAFRVSHPVVEVVDVGQDIRVSHHHAFGPARRTARVNQSHNRFGVINNVGGKIVSNLQGILIEHPLPRYPDRWGGQRGMTDQAMRSRIGEHPINFRQREPCVDWNRYDSEPATRVHQLDVLGAVRQKQGEPVSSAKTVGTESGCYAFNTLFQLGEG